MLKLLYGYGLDSDGTTLMLGRIAKRENKKTGKVEEYILKPIYPSSIKDAIRSLFKIKQREIIAEENLTFEEFFSKLEKIYEDFEKLLGNRVKDDIK